MKLAWGVLGVLALAHANSAHAQNFSGALLAKESWIELENSPLTTLREPVEVRTASVAGMIEAKGEHLALRLHGEASGTPEDPFDRTVIKVQEASAQARINDQLFISGGIQQRSWDSGNFYLPLGFFRSSVAQADPFDAEGRVTGAAMIALTHIGDRLVSETILSYGPSRPDVLFAKDQPALSVRVSGEPVRGLSTAGVLRFTPGHVSVGGSLSYAWDAVEAHADLLYGPPGARDVHQGINAATPTLYSTNPFIPVDLEGAVLTGVVGVNWTVTKEISAAAELIYRGDGLSDSQWDRYSTMVAFHSAAVRSPAAPRALRNLGWDRRVLGTRARRNYLAGYVNWSHGRVSVISTAVVGIADSSSSVALILSYSIPKVATVSATAVAQSGKPYSEFGMGGVPEIYSVRISRAF